MIKIFILVICIFANSFIDSFADSNIFMHNILHSSKNVLSNSKRFFSISMSHDYWTLQIPSFPAFAQNMCNYFSRGGTAIDNLGKQKVGTYHVSRLKHYAYTSHTDKQVNKKWNYLIKEKMSNEYLISSFFDSHLIVLDKNEENFFITENKNSIPTEYLPNIFLFAILDKKRTIFGKESLYDSFYHSFDYPFLSFNLMLSNNNIQYPQQTGYENHLHYTPKQIGWIDFLKYVQCKVEE